VGREAARRPFPGHRKEKGSSRGDMVFKKMLLSSYFKKRKKKADDNKKEGGKRGARKLPRVGGSRRGRTRGSPAIIGGGRGRSRSFPSGCYPIPLERGEGIASRLLPQNFEKESEEGGLTASRSWGEKRRCKNKLRREKGGSSMSSLPKEKRGKEKKGKCFSCLAPWVSWGGGGIVAISWGRIERGSAA